MSNKGNILSYFSHPIFQYKLENHKEHNRDLAKYIYQLYDEDKDGVQKTNINGWHSKPFIFSDKKMHHLYFLMPFKALLLMFLKIMVGYTIPTRLYVVACGQ
jgi:hypothetical protein|tara:strand:+ start:268 stop:573 length:306 start_codon:yes stop_codon:yes gene_type:complete